MLFFHFDVHFLFAFLKDDRQIAVRGGVFCAIENPYNNLSNNPKILLQVIERVRTIYLNPNETINEQTRSIKENPLFDEVACIKRWCVRNSQDIYWQPLIKVFQKILKKHS